MTLSADLKNIYEAGHSALPAIAAIYQERADEVDANVAEHERLTRAGTASAWPDALHALSAVMRGAAENLTQAGNVLQLIAWTYAETDEAAAKDLEKAAGPDTPREYVSGEWR